jgi:DNA-directed RNA polymerase subunit RPC12/RpoP
MRFKKMTLVDLKCPECNHVFEDLVWDTDEEILCPLCSALAKVLIKKLYPHPVSSTWSVKN